MTNASRRRRVVRGLGSVRIKETMQIFDNCVEWTAKHVEQLMMTMP
jgi:hypothetical protein